MNSSSTTPVEPTNIRLAPDAGARLSIDDIYFVLFRHKWKILFLTVVGFIGAVVVFKTWPQTVYRSEAKLFIRYLQENKVPGAIDNDSSIMSTARGETIITSELEILTSMDLAKKVAAKLGPTAILGISHGPSDVEGAAAMIRGGLTAFAPRGSRVVTLSFEHPDRSIVENVLKQVIEEYFKKHVEIHRTSGLYDDFLSKETLLLRSRLEQTEKELGRMKDRAGVISIDESKRAYAEQMSKVRQQILETEGLLAEKKAIIAEFGGTDQGDNKVPAEKLREHRNLTALLDALNEQEQQLLYSYNAETNVVATLRRRIADVESAKSALEQTYPIFVNRPSPLRGEGSTGSDSLNDERISVRALETRVNVLQQHLAKIRTEASELGNAELSITDLQRKRDLQEQHYRYFSASLEQSRINEALGSGRVSNISIVQEPTPPVSDVGKLYKVVGAIAASGLAAGIALAFCLELFVDRTVKRAKEIRSVLGLPLVLTIPKLGRLGRNKKSQQSLPMPVPRAPKPNALHELGRDEPVVAHPIESWTHPNSKLPFSILNRADHPLHPYFESLSNQLVHDFEVRDLTHKPKLIGVTSCATGSGVSTIAAGLAASLSKTGDGNVLLVDLNPNQTSRHLFQNGSFTCSLSEALEQPRREHSEQHLVVASNGEAKSQLQPKRFAHLLPKFKASDFDYIIFDLPPVNQLTTTAQLAGHMDTILMVVEAEKTTRDLVEQVASSLASNHNRFGVVFNKARRYLPGALSQNN